MTRKPLCLVALLVTTTAQARQPAPDTFRVTVSAAIDRAVAVSPDIRSSEAAVGYAGARLDLARASRFLTEFRATSAHSVAPGLDNPNDTPTDRLFLDPDVRNDWEDLRPFNRLEVEAIQPLFTWGEIGRSIDAARYGLEAEVQAVRSDRIQVALRTGELYYGLVLARSLERLTDEASKAVRDAKGEIERLLEEGDPDVDDADRFQVLITEQEFGRRVVEIRERLATVESGLRRQLMLPDGVVPLPGDASMEPVPFVPDSLDRYFEIALEERPEPARADAGVAARRALVGVARSAFYPKLFLGLEARYSSAEGRYRQYNPYLGDPFLSRTIRAGVGLRLDLNFLQTRAKVEQARSQLDEVIHQSEAARQLVLYEVESAWRTLKARQAAVSAAEEALHLSKEWLRTEQVNFDYDLGDTANLVSAVRANLELQAARHQAVYDYNVAVLRLLAAAGLLDRVEAFGMLLD
jgi:outer membrane protein TolC